MNKRTRRDRKGTAQNRVKKHEQKGKVPYISLPTGVSEYALTSDDTTQISIVGYDVDTDKNPFATKGKFHFERTFFVHKNLGPEKMTTIVCPNKTFGKKCPVCEYRATLDWDVDSEQTQMKALSPKERQLFNVLDHNAMDKGIQVWDMSYHLFGKVLDAMVKAVDKDDDDDTDDEFYYEEDGKILRVGWEEKKFGSGKYYDCTSIKTKKRKVDIDVEETPVHDLDSMIICPTYETVKALFECGDMPEDDSKTSEVEEEEEEEEVPKKKRKKPPAKEVEEEKEAEEAEVEEVEEAPKKKHKKPPVKEVEEEEVEAVEESPRKEEDSDEPTCPHKKGKYGVTCDFNEVCDDCPFWDGCDQLTNS